MREVNRSVEAFLQDFPTLFRYPKPLKSNRQCPKCKAKVVRIADRRFGGCYEEALFRCEQCGEVFTDYHKAHPFRIPCPDCGSNERVRRMRRFVVDGRAITLFCCQGCGRMFRDHYRKGYRPRGNTTAWKHSLLKGVICPECEQEYHIVLFGRTKDGRQQYQCRNCGRTFTKKKEGQNDRTNECR